MTDPLPSQKPPFEGFGRLDSLVKYTPPIRLLAIILLGVFLSEALVMILIAWVPSLSSLLLAIIDAFLLIVLVFPILYFFVLRKRIINYVSLRLIVIIESAVFLCEGLVMVLLALLPKLSGVSLAILDSFLLVALITPIFYFFLLRPMTFQIAYRKRAEDALRRSNELLERLFSITHVLYAYMDADFNFLQVNRTYAEAGNHAPEYFVGKNHFDLYPHEENEAIFRKVVETGEPFFIFDKPFSYPDQTEKGVTYWDWSLLPVQAPDGSVSGVLLSLIDVTDRKKAQLASIESERRFRAIFNHTFQFTGLLQPDGTVIEMNQTALDFGGWDRSQVVGRTLWEIQGDELIEDTRGRLRSAVSEASAGNLVRGEIEVRGRDPHVIVMDFSIKPVSDDGGKVNLLIWEARDITARNHAEALLAEKNRELLALSQKEHEERQLAEILSSASRALTETLNLETVLERLLDYVCQLVPFDSAEILLVDERGKLSVRAARGHGLYVDRLPKSVPAQFLAEPLVERLFADRQSILIPDTLARPGWIAPVGNGNGRTWLGIPLVAGEQVIGLCGMTNQMPGFYNSEHIRVVETLANQAAVVVQNAWLFDQVRGGRERLQSLSHRLVQIQESERRYIARELHDEAGQALTSLMLGLGVLEKEMPVDRFEQVEKLKGITDSVLENLHRLAMDLRPASLDHLGLVEAIQQYIKTLDRAELEIQFKTVGFDGPRLPLEMETALYRIILEALTNVSRHSNARRVDVLLERRHGKVIAMVEDDGIGFEVEERRRVGHLGLIGMQERAEMLGGKIEIESAPGVGTTLVVEVPDGNPNIHRR